MTPKTFITLTTTTTLLFCALILTQDVMMVQGSVAVNNEGPTLLGLGEDYGLG